MYKVISHDGWNLGVWVLNPKQADSLRKSKYKVIHV